VRLAFDLFSGHAGANHDLIRFQASEVEIRGRKPIQIDGDFIGYGPAIVKMVADFARIVV